MLGIEIQKIPMLFIVFKFREEHKNFFQKIAKPHKCAYESWNHGNPSFMLLQSIIVQIFDISELSGTSW